ncbi:phthiocerol/phthiodiolone dimycocerosyl transferase family protein [Phormidesmis priestleyi]
MLPLDTRSAFSAKRNSEGTEIEARPLAANEQMMEILNRQGSGSLNVITISQIKGSLTPNLVRQAIAHLQQQHPRLNSRIVGSLDSLSFDHCDLALPLRVVNSSHKQQWQEVACEEMNQPIESQKGLLRAVLVQSVQQANSCHLITTTHHAISDGLSCIRLHSELLTYCQKATEGKPIELVRLPLLPALESFLPTWTKGWLGTLNAILFGLGLTIQRLKHRPEHIPLKKSTSLVDRTTGLVHRQMDQALTQKIIDHCKQRKTTVHSALAAAMLLATAETITPDRDRPICMNCQSALDLRRRLKNCPDERQLGLFVTSVITYHTIDPKTSLWNLAQQVKSRIQSNIKWGHIFRFPLTSKFFTEYYLSHPSDVNSTVFLTNIGLVSVPSQYGLFELEDIHFTVSNVFYAGSLAASVATFAGKISLNFMFSQPSLSRETIEQLADSTLAYLSKACQPATLNHHKTAIREQP